MMTKRGRCGVNFSKLCNRQELLNLLRLFHHFTDDEDDEEDGDDDEDDDDDEVVEMKRESTHLTL